MTGIRQPLAALRDRLGSTPSAVRVARSRPARVRMLAATATIVILVGGMSVATAPVASAVSCPTVDRTGSTPYPVTPPPSLGVNWSGCDLHGADLTAGTLMAATLIGSNLAGAVATGRNLQYAVLTNANLTGILISGADLQYAALNDANLTDAKISNANLSDANLFRANLTRADLNSANVARAAVQGIFVTCGTGGVLGTSMTGTLSIYTPLPSGWTFTAGTLTAPNAACSGGGSASPASPAPAAPPAPPLPAPESLPPVPGIAPAAEIPVGGSLGSVNGVPVTTTVTVNSAGGVQVAGGGSTVALADLGPDGNPLPASGGGLSGTPGGGLSVSASGLLPQSQADVYMYSEQLWLGKATVDGGGNVSMSLTIPSWVTPGAHTLQFVGYQGPYTSIALSTGITVAAPAAASAAVQPVSGDATGYFRPGAVALTYAAKARLWNAVNAPAQGNAGAAVACSATHVKPETASERALWAQRDTGVAGFLTRAGCDTVTARLGDLAGIAGAASMAIRITATAA